MSKRDVKDYKEMENQLSTFLIIDNESYARQQLFKTNSLSPTKSQLLLKSKNASQITNLQDLKKVTPAVRLLGQKAESLNELRKNLHPEKKMTPRVRQEMQKYCRACAGLKVPLVNIFSDKGVQMRLNQQMKHLEDINPDSLTTQMCMDCICDLKMSYKFFMQIKKAEVKLKTIHSSLVDVYDKDHTEQQSSTEHSYFGHNIKQEIMENLQEANLEDDSIEEFDPDDPPFQPSEGEELTSELENGEKDKRLGRLKHFEGLKSYITVPKEQANLEPKVAQKPVVPKVNSVMNDEMLLKTLESSVESNDDLSNDGLKQVKVKEEKVQKEKTQKANVQGVPNLQNVISSTTKEDGIMYVTMKGSKPNELLLVKVKKMDKPVQDSKKIIMSEKSLSKTPIDIKPIGKFLSKYESLMKDKDLFSNKKSEEREQIIEEQIEEYKRKREKILGKNVSGTVDSIRMKEDEMKMDLENDSIDLTKDLVEEDAKETAPFDRSLPVINEVRYNDKTWEEEAKEVIEEEEEEQMTKEELLDDTIESDEGRLEKLIGETEYLHDFLEYLKSRRIVISRLKDDDVVQLYDGRYKKDPFDESYADKLTFDCDFCLRTFTSKDKLEDHVKCHDFKILHFCEDCGEEFSTNKSRRNHNVNCAKKLICRYCNVVLESKGKKRQHEQKHCDNMFGQLCDICGEKFKHQGTLDQHIKTRHMDWEKIFQCPKCPKKFAFKTKLSFHLKSVHTSVRAYLCEDCGADFKNPASLRHHRIRKHQPIGNKRQCSVCNKMVPFYSLSKHMHTHKEYSIKCPYCDKMFKNTSTLKQHTRIHEDQRQYRCDTCGVGFNRRDGLRLHMRVHEKTDSRGLKECSCQVCGEKFPNHSMLVIHRNRVHKDGRHYTCRICNRSMISARSLDWHLTHIHNEASTRSKEDSAAGGSSESKRVSCYHCNKTFKTEMILRTHVKNTHTQKDPVKCLDCDQMFTSEVRLRHHMMVEHNRLEGTLQCPHCPKRFVNQLRLKTHMISHSEDRPYRCEICGFNLKTKIQLIKHHQNRHSDERPLKCRYCDWRCKQVSALVCHERTHTNERPYSCSVCRQRFKYLGDKNKHERRHESLGGTGFKRNSKVSHKRLKTEHEGETSASEQDETIIGTTIGEVLATSEVDEVQYEEGTIKFETQELTEYETYEQVPENMEVANFQTVTVVEEIDDSSVHAADGIVQSDITNLSNCLFVQDFEETSQEASEAQEVIMNMDEDGHIYTEEVTADNIESSEIISGDLMTNQLVVLDQHDENGKVHIIPVTLSLPDLTDANAEVNLATASIMYNN